MSELGSAGLPAETAPVSPHDYEGGESCGPHQRFPNLSKIEPGQVELDPISSISAIGWGDEIALVGFARTPTRPNDVPRAAGCAGWVVADPFACDRSIAHLVASDQIHEQGDRRVSVATNGAR